MNKKHRPQGSLVYLVQSVHFTPQLTKDTKPDLTPMTIIANSLSGFPDPSVMYNKFILLHFPRGGEEVDKIELTLPDTKDKKTVHRLPIDTSNLALLISRRLNILVYFTQTNDNPPTEDVCEFFLDLTHNAVAINSCLIEFQELYPWMILRANDYSIFPIYDGSNGCEF